MGKITSAGVCKTSQGKKLERAGAFAEGTPGHHIWRADADHMPGVVEHFGVEMEKT